MKNVIKLYDCNDKRKRDEFALNELCLVRDEILNIDIDNGDILCFINWLG